MGLALMVVGAILIVGAAWAFAVGKYEDWRDEWWIKAQNPEPTTEEKLAAIEKEFEEYRHNPGKEMAEVQAMADRLVDEYVKEHTPKGAVVEKPSPPKKTISRADYRPKHPVADDECDCRDCARLRKKEAKKHQVVVTKDTSDLIDTYGATTRANEYINRIEKQARNTMACGARGRHRYVDWDRAHKIARCGDCGSEGAFAHDPQLRDALDKLWMDSGDPKVVMDQAEALVRANLISVDDWRIVRDAMLKELTDREIARTTKNKAERRIAMVTAMRAEPEW
jgi:hypothetical protein